MSAVRGALKDSFWLFEPDTGIKYVLRHLGLLEIKGQEQSIALG
jgi:hypothetical protein